MAQDDQRDTLFDRLLRSLRNNKLVVAILLSVAVLGGANKVLDSADGLWTRIMNIFPSPSLRDEHYEQAVRAYRLADTGTAFKQAQLSADAGSPYGRALLAYLYARGFGVARDVEAANYNGELAISLIQHDADNRVPAALRTLAMFYEQGIVVPKSDLTAFDYHKQAAYLGDAWSQNSLGTIYLGNLGVPENPDEARKWFEEAAKDKDAIAQFNLGNVYENGLGVDPRVQTH